MLGSLGWEELLIILVIVALVFGASRVSDLGRSLGRGIKEFREEIKTDDDPKKTAQKTEQPTTSGSDRPPQA